MWVVSRRALVRFWTLHPDAKKPLSAWFRTARRLIWRGIRDVRQQYPHADLVKVGSGETVVVFNIAGNKYRLVTAIHYNRAKVYVLRAMTHAEYSKERWKEQL